MCGSGTTLQIATIHGHLWYSNPICCCLQVDSVTEGAGNIAPHLETAPRRGKTSMHLRAGLAFDFARLGFGATPRLPGLRGYGLKFRLQGVEIRAQNLEFAWLYPYGCRDPLISVRWFTRVPRS